MTKPYPATPLYEPPAEETDLSQGAECLSQRRIVKALPSLPSIGSTFRLNTLEEGSNVATDAPSNLCRLQDRHGYVAMSFYRRTASLSGLCYVETGTEAEVCSSTIRI
jgi:hypothetical protein